jgi:hypothetical protein
MTGHRWFLALALLLAAGCGGDDKGEQTTEPIPTCDQADVYTRGMEKTGDEQLVRIALLEVDPAPPQAGVRGMWRVRVTDMNGAPIEGAVLVIDTYMPPPHGHGATVTNTAKPLGQGEFEITPMYFFMGGGVWEITIIVQREGEEIDRVKFIFCM